VNFLGEEGAARVRSAYGNEKYQRLAAVKEKWDPTNFLRHNHNIEPRQGRGQTGPATSHHVSKLSSLDDAIREGVAETCPDPAPATDPDAQGTSRVDIVGPRA
jgi:hypothetical protein